MWEDHALQTSARACATSALLLQGGSPSAERPAAQADMAAGPPQGMPAAGARGERGTSDVSNGSPSDVLQNGRPVEARARELAAKAAMTTVYSGPALFTEVKGAARAAADLFERGVPLLEEVSGTIEQRAGSHLALVKTWHISCSLPCFHGLRKGVGVSHQAVIKHISARSLVSSISEG